VVVHCERHIVWKQQVFTKCGKDTRAVACDNELVRLSLFAERSNGGWCAKKVEMSRTSADKASAMVCSNWPLATCIASNVERTRDEAKQRS
jgi:hypothetical protein